MDKSNAFQSASRLSAFSLKSFFIFYQMLMPIIFEAGAMKPGRTMHNQPVAGFGWYAA